MNSVIAGCERMKKSIVILLCCVAVAAAAAAGAWFSLNYGDRFVSYPVRKVEPVEKTGVVILSEDEESVTLQKTGEGPWKVLMFTDIHLDHRVESAYLQKHAKIETYTAFDRMIKTVQREKPDLVLFGGDNVTNGWNHKRTRTMGRALERLGVYWGGVIGNHEGDSFGSYTRKNMVKKFASYDHCIMRLGPEDIDGVCNYCIHLLNSDGSHAETVFCLDTHDHITEEIRASHEIIEDKPDYDGAHENQVMWYSTKAEALKARFGDYRSILLQHIPLPAFDRAVESGVLLYGEQNEPICSTCYENGLFDAIKKAGVTRAVFCGHDHINNFGAEYEGVVLSYIESSGYGAYGMINEGAPESQWLQGYTTLIIAPDGSYSHTQTRYVDVFDPTTNIPIES